MSQRKAYGLLVLCYALWGFQPFYWNLCDGLDSLYLLAVRTLCCCLFTGGVLAVQGRLGELWALLRSRRLMARLAPAALFLLVDWGVYTVAVRGGHVLDSSLGYYLNPLVTFLIGLLVFRERCRWPRFAALGLAMLGVAISAVVFRSVSWVTPVLALAWAFYATLQKQAGQEALVSLTAETLLLAPFALAFVAVSRLTGAATAPTWGEAAFLLGSGVVTALPMLLFSACVVRVPLSVLSFFQYLSPTFAIFSGLLLGEAITPARWVSFAFIWAGIAVFTVSGLRESHALKI